MVSKTIDIVMTTFNGCKYIQKQIESILEQTIKDWELFIRDDGSTDDTLRIINEFKKRYSDKIFIINNSFENLGSKRSFGRILETIDSNYFMFCDQDDIWLPEKMEIALKRMLELEGKYGRKVPILIHTDLKVVDEELNIHCDSLSKYQNLKSDKVKTFNRLLVQNIITGSTVMINRALKEIAIPIPERAIMHDWWFGLVASAFGKVDYINIPTVLYRQHDLSEIGAKRWDLLFILKGMTSLKDKKISIENTINQAKCFLERYRSELSSNDLEMVKAYAQLNERNFLKKRLLIIKHRFFKIGIIRNLGMFLEV